MIFKYSRFPLMLLSFFCLSISFSVQGASLSGKITDNSGGEPMLGATISIRSIGAANVLTGAVTNENGDYLIDNIEMGEYTVIVSFIGYTSQVLAFSPVNEPNTNTIDIALIPSVMNLSGISVTASRRPEKILDAPASVTRIETEQIANRTVLSPTEHLDGIAGVDVAHTGLNQSNVVVRGFNNIFSGALLVLTDNRIAHVPSLRFNAHNFISTTNDDIDHIEVVSGPGSALYGPNAAAGVMHIVTKSPFGSEGTTVSLGAGERDLRLGSFRHAGTVNNRLGYKITGQYYEGTDWPSSDEREPALIQKYRPTSEGPIPVGDTVDNRRDFDSKKMSAEARVDYLATDDLTFTLNGGYNQSSSIELTGLGAGQAIDWSYTYFQARMRFKDLFVQGFVNASDAGDTYLLQSGQLIVDKSKMMVGQIQHNYDVNDGLSLTYGVDLLFTRPNTDGTINGANEDDDDIDEIGVYVQGDKKLSDKLKFVGAIRVDDNSRLDDMFFSPRAAFVYQPSSNHNFRATYNRAFSTPDNNSLFLDLLQSPDPFHTGIDVRVQGVPESGFHWSTTGGEPLFHALGQDTIMAPIAYTGFTNYSWQIGRVATINSISDALGQAVDAATAAYLTSIIGDLAPGTIPGMPNEMRRLNPDDNRHYDIGMIDVSDISRLEPTITQTFELGYKGIINERFQFSFDAYYTKKNNFIGPLTVESPSVMPDYDSMMVYLAPYFASELADLQANDSTGYAAVMSAINGLCEGCPAHLVLADAFATGANNIPWGTWAPDEATDPTALLITYRNFGDINFFGADLSFAYHVNQSWNVGGTYSYVSKNFWAKSASQVHDINLNAPRHKFGAFVEYSNVKYGLNAKTRLRFVDAFDMDSPFIGTTVESFTVVDLNLAVDIIANTSFSLTVQNIFDNEHTEFVGAPMMGRLMIGRVTQSF